MGFRVNATKIAVIASFFAGLSLPAQALAEYYVPPGNSAANQYTEALPSAGGESAGKGGGKAVPAKTLGAGNAKKLKAQGPAGEAAAEAAAETAPPANLDNAAETTGDGGKPASHHHQSKGSGQPATGQNGGGSGGGSSGSGGSSGGGGETTRVEQPSGSSGLGEVVSQATGSADDGNLGIWLPILIIATIAGSIAYRLRSRREPAP